MSCLIFLAHSTCLYDGVKIYDGDSMSGNPMATLCGNTIPGSFSTFGPMLVNFYSDSIIQSKGFLAEYTAVRECCLIPPIHIALHKTSPEYPFAVVSLCGGGGILFISVRQRYKTKVFFPLGRPRGWLGCVSRYWNSRARLSGLVIGV